MSGPEKRHELHQFMDAVKQQMGAGFQRISKRSKEDPGTAGDQVEENWAKFLRDWIPATYPVVTKGRILNSEGQATPQVDILILQPNYPKCLLNQKHYFAGGVVAAFECKLTLRSRDLDKFFQTSKVIKNISPQGSGSPFNDLHQSPYYGLLALSTDIPEDGKKGIHERIFSLIDRVLEHPRELPDIICINSSTTYSLQKRLLISDHATAHSKQLLDEVGATEALATMYLEECEFMKEEGTSPNSTGFNLAALIRSIYAYIGFRDKSVRTFSDYFQDISGFGGIGKHGFWGLACLSQDSIDQLKEKGFQNSRWSEWSEDFDPL